MSKFARTLRSLMRKKKLSASDLAGKVFNYGFDERGYIVSKGRDRIGHYLSGESFPNADNLIKLADALGVEPAVLEAARPTPKVRKPK